MATNAHLLLLAIAVILCSGCDPAVQARSQPTSVEEVFGVFSRISNIESEVYELPAAPPDLAGEARAKRPCRPPGQLMKPTSMAAFQDTYTHERRGDSTAMGAWDEPLLKSPGPGPAYAIASWEPAMRVGAKESTPTAPFKPVVEPGRSIYRVEPMTMSAWRSDDYSWCNPEANKR
ncbi:MAG: hypothetical protein AAB263_07365 [Planctomycetota bacterium]